MMKRISQDNHLMAFFSLVIVLMIPFWILGGITGISLLPGLPIAALGVICPVTAALILVYRENKWPGVVALLKRSFDARRIQGKRWYLPILLIMPAVMALSFGVLRWIGVPVPPPQATVGEILALSVVFFLGALGEELGWSGYALEPMQVRWGALYASLLLGGFWAVYHYPALLQAHRSLAWIAWWTLGTLSTRVIMVWLFQHTGKSVFAMALFHMMDNITWQLFPVNGSFFNPQVTGLILAAVAVILMVVWNPDRKYRQFRTDQARTDSEVAP